MMRIDTNACFGHWPYWDLRHKSAEDLVAIMDRFGIAQACALSLRGVLVDWRAGNEETFAAACRFPDRLLPFVTLSPFMRGNGDELRRLAAAGARGLRLYPAFHSYPLDSKFVDDVCRAAGECGLPVLIATRPMMNWRFNILAIDRIGVVVARHPKTAFIISGPNYLVEFQALVKLMRACSNATYEHSCMQGFDAIPKLIACVGADRVLFGTGAVLHYAACNVAKLDGAHISDTDRELIANGNALRLLSRSVKSLK